MIPFIGFWKDSGVPNPPILACTPPQTWPSQPGGVPYINSGNTTDGLTDLYSDGLPSVIGGELSYDFPVNTDPDPFSGTLELTGFSFPVQGGDFDATFEFRVTDSNYAYDANLLFYSNNDQGFSFGFGAFTVTTGGLRAKYDCDIITTGEGAADLPFSPPLPTGGLINDQSWHEYRVTRTGTVFEVFMDTVSYGTWDSSSEVVGKLGLTLSRRTWDSGTTQFRIRNISIV